MAPLRVGAVYELTIAEPPASDTSPAARQRAALATSRGTFRVLGVGDVMVRLVDTAHSSARVLHIPQAWVVQARPCG